MPRCVKCDTDKSPDKFCPSFLKLKRAICKDCLRIYRNGNRKSINSVIGALYRYQKRTAQVDYSLEELCNWLHKKSKFFSFYRSWAEGDYAPLLIPCVVRLDFSKHFSLDNIEVVTRKNVFAKNKKDHIRKVIQMDRDGNDLATFPNAHVAGQMLNVNYMNIYSICTHRSGRISCGGFRWKFA